MTRDDDALENEKNLNLPINQHEIMFLLNKLNFDFLRQFQFCEMIIIEFQSNNETTKKNSKEFLKVRID